MGRQSWLEAGRRTRPGNRLGDQQISLAYLFLPSGVMSALKAARTLRTDACWPGSRVQELPIRENSARSRMADDARPAGVAPDTCTWGRLPGCAVLEWLTSLDLRFILTKSAQHAEKIQYQRDEHDGPDYPQAPTSSPSGIPVIAATCAEQQQQNDD